ncbi:MAG: glutamine synthetase family protein [Clostridia bacterium]
MSSRNISENIRNIISEGQIHTVRVCVHDNANIQRARFVSSRHFLDNVINKGLACPSVIFSFDSSAELIRTIGNGFEGGYPSWLLKPDLNTFNVIPYSPGTARVIADLYDNNLEAVKFSPRYVLKNVLSKYEAEGIKVKGAFEYEFFVFEKDKEKLEPIWTGSNYLSEIKQANIEKIILSVMHNLSEMGAGPEVANTEYAEGQFEITNSPFWNIEIADMAYYYRTSIKEIVERLGYTATFMAKPIANQCGSGAHIHLSLYDQSDNNLISDTEKKDGLSDLCRYFIGGQLQHARALCALVNPTLNSYKRLQPYTFAPTTASWGYEHRGAMIRVPGARGENARIENRLPGADTNPYISLAAILAAGLDGIKNKTEPSQPLVLEDAYICNRTALPKSLEEAILDLKSSRLFSDALGSEFINHFITLRESEINRFKRHITDWEYKEYMELL